MVESQLRPPLPEAGPCLGFEESDQGAFTGTHLATPLLQAMTNGRVFVEPFGDGSETGILECGECQWIGRHSMELDDDQIFEMTTLLPSGRVGP
jgi:hypothetical protein